MILMLKVLLLKMVKKYINTNFGVGKVFLAGVTQNKQKSLKFDPYKCKSFVVYTFFYKQSKILTIAPKISVLLNNSPGRTRDEN